MKYTVRCGKKHQVKIERSVNTNKEIDIQVGKKTFTAAIKDVHPDGTLRTVIINNKIYPVQIDKRIDGFPEKVILNGVTFDVEIEKVESTRYRPKSADKKISGAIKSSLPGQIIAILVKKGDRVKKGQPLIILESMKMENEVLSPKNGVIAKLHVKPGQVVLKTHLLVEVT
ncbi:MAG: biotin/lipoyl-binding protein [Deltaproteobacteria bacterium]|nr:biotin/lipoyl-binding protein [Deltaproteobacteria bacterium]